MRWSSFTLGGSNFFISAAKLGSRRCGWRVCLVAFVVLCRGEGEFIDVKYGDGRLQGTDRHGSLEGSYRGGVM
jgi:hypothetical protein